MSKSPSRILTEEKHSRYLKKSLKYLSENCLEKSQKLFESLSSSPSLELLCMNNLSFIYTKQKKFNKAINILLKAYARSRTKSSHKEYLGTLINLTAAASNLNIHSEALNYALQARQTLTSDDKEIVHIVLFNIGIEQLYLSSFTEAEENLSQSLCKMNELGIENDLTNQIKSALLLCVSSNYKEPRFCKLIENFKKKSGKKVASDGEIPANEIKQEKVRSLAKRSDSQSSTRHLAKAEKTCSSTSSTESINSINCPQFSNLTKSSSLRKTITVRKYNHELASVKSAKINLSNSHKIGNRLNHIDEHLNSLEKNINNFIEMYKPLKILTEDPDEQLDSSRYPKSFFQNTESQYYKKRLAAIKIQRAFRKFRSAKHENSEKSLLTFKDNPLFKPILFKSLNKNNAR